MSAFSNTADLRDLPVQAGQQAATRHPPKPWSGPVLMGDIHPAVNGRPLLLMLWAHWADREQDPGPEPR